MSSSKPYHLHTSADKGGWIIRREGATKGWLWFQTKQSGLDWAKSIGLGLIVHREDGTVQAMLRLNNE